jgi:hypothetical protein
MKITKDDKNFGRNEQQECAQTAKKASGILVSCNVFPTEITACVVLLRSQMCQSFAVTLCEVPKY